MVGGLIQQQDVRIRQQELAQSHTGLLASGEGIRLLGELIFCKTKPLEYTDDLTFAGVAVSRFELGLKPVVGLQSTFQSFSGKGFQLMFYGTDPFLHLKDVGLCAL